MWQIIGIIVTISLLIVAVKIAIILLVLAGLIFRTKETVGLLLFVAGLTAFNAHPKIGIGIAVVFLMISLFYKRKEKPERPYVTVQERMDSHK